MTRPKVVVRVQDGVAEIIEAPPCIDVEIIDLDVLSIQDAVFYSVDIPTVEPTDLTVTWVRIDSFSTKEQAADLCRRWFGADEKGRVSLITEHTI